MLRLDARRAADPRPSTEERHVYTHRSRRRWTFTDLIFFDGETGQVTVGKGPSNPRDVDLAVRSVVTSTLDPEAASRTELFLHGTTVGLNALLERKGARVGLLTTDGFRDILEQARMERLDERGHRVWDHLFRTPRAAGRPAPARRRAGADPR